MKLIIQVPCFNEEESLPITLQELPRSVAGFDQVEWLVIDDGSRDRTSEVARAYHVDHITRLPKHLGLGQAFACGIQFAISCGADVILNTDADNQYCAKDIPNLVEPLLSNRADIAIGVRPIADIPEFSCTKKFLQKLGSKIVRMISGTEVQDATCGFRAFNRKTALNFSIHETYSYTIDTILQSGFQKRILCNVPIRVNPSLRPSRLARNTFTYVFMSMISIIRLTLFYTFTHKSTKAHESHDK